MKESRQNGREVTAQDNNITENIHTRSLLIFRNLVYVVAHIQYHKTQRKLERCCVQVKVL